MGGKHSGPRECRRTKLAAPIDAFGDFGGGGSSAGGGGGHRSRPAGGGGDAEEKRVALPPIRPTSSSSSSSSRHSAVPSLSPVPWTSMSVPLLRSISSSASPSTIAKLRPTPPPPSSSSSSSSSAKAKTPTIRDREFRDWHRLPLVFTAGFISLLDVRDHCALARVSRHLFTASQQNNASPYAVTYPFAVGGGGTSGKVWSCTCFGDAFPGVTAHWRPTRVTCDAPPVPVAVPLPKAPKTAAAPKTLPPISRYSVDQRSSQRSSPPASTAALRGEAALRSAQQPHGQHSSPSGRSGHAGGCNSGCFGDNPGGGKISDDEKRRRERYAAAVRDDGVTAAAAEIAEAGDPFWAWLWANKSLAALNLGLGGAWNGDGAAGGRERRLPPQVTELKLVRGIGASARRLVTDTVATLVLDGVEFGSDTELWMCLTQCPRVTTLRLDRLAFATLEVMPPPSDGDDEDDDDEDDSKRFQLSSQGALVANLRRRPAAAAAAAAASSSSSSSSPSSALPPQKRRRHPLPELLVLTRFVARQLHPRVAADLIGRARHTLRSIDVVDVAAVRHWSAEQYTASVAKCTALRDLRFVAPHLPAWHATFTTPPPLSHALRVYTMPSLSHLPSLHIERLPPTVSVVRTETTGAHPLYPAMAAVAPITVSSASRSTLQSPPPPPSKPAPPPSLSSLSSRPPPSSSSASSSTASIAPIAHVNSCIRELHLGSVVAAVSLEQVMLQCGVIAAAFPFLERLVLPLGHAELQLAQRLCDQAVWLRCVTFRVERAVPRPTPGLMSPKFARLALACHPRVRVDLEYVDSLADGGGIDTVDRSVVLE